MGHMKAIGSNTRPTTRSTTNYNEKESTKDEDDGSVLKLDPPCMQIESGQEYHVAFRIINISAEINGLKCLVSTDLPGYFSFTSNKGNNYIMCMYDYDSNVI